MNLLQDEKRMGFGDWVDKIFEVALIALVAYGVTKIDSMQKSIQALNQTLAVTINTVANQSTNIKENKESIEGLKEDFESFKIEYYKRGNNGKDY